LRPDVPNVYNDFHTKENIRQFAYGFMINGFGIDRDHDNIDISSGIRIVESFIAQPNDPRGFVDGSWVVGIYVIDDTVWQDIVSGELTGFSYEALVTTFGVLVNVEDNRQVVGQTFPDPDDGHVHDFWAVTDAEGRVITGGTTSVNQHSHSISATTYTERDSADSHRHRYSLMNSGEANAQA